MNDYHTVIKRQVKSDTLQAQERKGSLVGVHVSTDGDTRRLYLSLSCHKHLRQKVRTIGCSARHRQD